jgi:hypothetical protein
VVLDCGPGGGVINAVQFASFGQPTGVCGAYAAGACAAANSTAVVEAACVGQPRCELPTAPGANAFGAPCGASAATWLAVQVTCSARASFAYWDLSQVDAFVSDFWQAVDGNASQPIPNFSTQPSWLYDASAYTYPEDGSRPWYGYDRGTAPASNSTMLSDYYGRLYSYLMRGSLVDEAGVTHTSPHPPFNITLIEVYNEPDYEHGHTPQSYVRDYDAQVRGVRAWADPNHTVSFVGLNLPNIDSSDKLSTWATYFLTPSNHDDDVADAVANGAGWVGYHSYPTNGGYTPDPNTFTRLFDYAESFINGSVAAVDAVIARLSPGTRTALDETGTDMDGVLGPGPPPGNNPRYWVASGAYFAYMFFRVAATSPTVRVLGASQLMDAPGQEPSVTLLDWSTGAGTARFWVVKLLVDETAVGDEFAATTSTSTPASSPAGGDSAAAVAADDDGGGVFAQAFTSPSDGARRLALVNKRHGWANVTVECGAGCACVAALVVDEATGLQPARAGDACATAGGGVGVTLAPFATAVLRLSAA